MEGLTRVSLCTDRDLYLGSPLDFSTEVIVYSPIYKLNWLLALYKPLETLSHVSFCITKSHLYEREEVGDREREREKFGEVREEEEKKEKNNFNKIYSDSKIEIIQKTSTYNTYILVQTIQ